MSQIQDKFGVFWYNQTEICQWSDADFEAKAREFTKTGVNIVMTFSCTHFRWSFYPYWQQINEALAKMVRACHKYNIRVVEHHSSTLTHNPRSYADWERLKCSMRIRHGALDMFPGLRDHIASGDPEIRSGVHLSDCRQIDGRNGDYVTTEYKGYVHCYNNEAFVDAYLESLETMYRTTGIDGIMTDDVHYYASGNSCACPACRKKFKEETGYDLPSPSNWADFSWNYDNPAFIAWQRFRTESTARFQRKVSAHAASLGLKMLRPNYHTSCFQRMHTAYPFENVGDLWSHVFQENRFSSVIRASYPAWTTDAVHRTAMARKHSIDPMSLFYPARPDDYYFCWALSRAWEHLLMVTPEGADLNNEEQQYLEYEKIHRRLAGKADPLAEVAFYLPRASFDYTPDGLESGSRPFCTWIQAGVFCNLRETVIFEDDPLEKYLQYPLIVLTGARMLTDEALERFAEYCRRGGKLLIHGEFGIFNPDCTRREHPEKVFNFQADINGLHQVPAGTFQWQGETLTMPEVEESCTLSNVVGDVKVVARGSDGSIYAVSAMNGNLVWFAGGIRSRHPEAEHYAFSINRWGADPYKKEVAPYFAADYQKNVPGRIMVMLLNNDQVISCSSGDYMLTAFRDEETNCCNLHMVNVAGVLARPPEMISHSDIFVNFLKDSPKNQTAMELKFKLPEGGGVPKKIQAFSPEFTGGKELSYQRHGNKLYITIPAGCFAGYLHIKINN